jgi:RecB family exonuclease
MSSNPIRLLARRPLCSPGFTRKLLAELEIAKRFAPQEILYLTPNKRRAHSAEFEIASLYPDAILQTPKCLDLQTLARELVLSRAQKGIVDERDRRFILLKLIHESDDLLFGEEHLGLLSNLYAELKRYHPQEWEKIPELSKQVIFDADTALRLKQAVALLAQYEDHLEEQRLLDHEMFSEETVRLAPSFNYKLVIVEGYFEPGRTEQEMFKALFSGIPEVIIIIPEHKLAAEGERFFANFNLVQHTTPKPEKLPESSWLRYPSREDEVAAIARRICALAEQGVSSRDVMVVFPALEVYRPIVQRVFARYGLNAQVSIRPRLETYPGIRVILDLIQTAEQGFRRRDVVGLLLAPAFKAVPESVRGWIDVLSRNQGIVSGERSWTEWFLSETPWELQKHPGGKKITSEVRGFVKRFIAKLKTLVIPCSIQEFSQKLGALLKFLGWKVTEELEQRFILTIEKLCRMAELAGEAEVAPRFIRETLDILLKAEVPESETDTPNPIRVMPVVESRWLDAGYLFVAGLVDGEFPRRPRRDLLLPEPLRESLGLPGAEYEFANAEFEYQRLLSMAREKIFLSAPSMEGDRPLIPSVFLTETVESARPGDLTIYCQEEKQLLEPRARKESRQGVIFTEPSTLEILNTRFGAERSFRVTSLETYRTCPYRYYLRTVLGLQPCEEPTAEPEGRLLGSILHDTLERLFKEKFNPDRIDEQLWNHLLVELDRRKLNSDMNPFVRIWIEDWVSARRDWFCDEEQAAYEEGWRVDPEWLERSLEYSFTEQGFKLRGRVDRVDWQGNRARVLDYKTGKEDSFGLKIRKGLSIQLPLYCEMIRRLHGASIDSFGIYSFSDSQIKQITPPDQAIAAAVRFAADAVSGIRTGQFVNQQNPLCRYCEYNEHC